MPVSTLQKYQVQEDKKHQEIQTGGEQGDMMMWFSGLNPRIEKTLVPKLEISE